MRGRKHPLEIFRNNGREFVTRRAAGRPTTPAESPATGEESVAEERADRVKQAAASAEAARNDRLVRAREELRPGSAERPDAVPTPNPPVRSPRGKSAPPTPRPHTPLMPRTNRSARRSEPMPLWQAGLLAAGLVLALGGAYVVGLWPFTGPSGTGQDPVNLKRFDSLWRDPTVDLEQGDGSEASTEETETGAQALTGDAQGRPAAPEVADGSRSAEAPAAEYRILAASDLLGTGEKEQEMRSRMEEQRSRLARKLAPEFGAVPVDVSFLRGDRSSVLLLVGRADRKDDASLKRLLERVKGAGGFDDATIKLYRTSARGKRDG